MQAFWWWWGLAVLLGILELVTGTLTLLVLALGFAAGGVVAYLGGGLAWELVATAAVSLVGWFLLRRYSPRQVRAPSERNRDMLLDIGERVRVEHWREGRAQVVYRGASWEAELESGEPVAGEFVIRRIEGNRLILGREG